MKVKLYDKEDNELVCGEFEIPDDVLEAARKVSDWLEKQAAPIELYGVGLRG